MKNFLLLATLAIYFFACTPKNTDNSTDEAETETKEVVGGVSFMNIAEGDTISSPFLLEMGV